jgi:hypothetical protein
MAAEKQNELMALVDSIPPKYIDSWRARFTEYHKRTPNEADEADYVGSTLRDLTWYWREALSAERQRELEEYVATKGDPEAWRNAFRSPEERSPLGPADFAATDAEEIARYLRDWEPGAGPASQTKTALAFELRRAVQAAPEKFSKGARAFADLPPLYVRRLFEGLQQSALNKASTDWSATLDLIESVLSSATSPAPGELSEGGDDPSSFWAAKEAIILLRTCLQRGEGIIGYEHADRLKSTICLVEKCAPAIPELPDFEERYVQNPYFGAEATMFGLAVELNVLFVYWASRHKESAVSADQSKALSSTPEFVGFAERALGYDAEKGRIARAVFGRYLSWLIHFGEEWVRQNFTLIFPSDRPLRDAAWLGYLLSDNRPARHFVQEMRPMYEDEIAEFKNENADESRFYRESRCAEYLTVLYLWGILPPDLHDLFLKSASNRLRKHVMWFIGRDLKSPNLPTDIRSRALAYWETRLAAGLTATDKGKYRDELGIFGTWDGASAIDTEWLLTQQIKMFTAGYSPSNAFSVVEWAAKAAPDYPDQTVEMVAALFNIPKLDHWAYTATQSPVRAILTAGLGSSSADTHERVRRIVSFLASVGETSVLDLVNK